MVRIESFGYPVCFDENLAALEEFLRAGSYSQVLILVDRNTGEHCLPVLQQKLPDLLNFDIIEIDPGEENKNIDFCIGVWSTMLDFGADRNSLLINLGGGVVTDMGGFAASTYKRGIDFVHIPTTLLSQVDASVGGKTGIDMNEFKNVIGTFSQPKSVFVSTAFLNTLDDREWRSGFAEILKHGLIRDARFFANMQNLTSVKSVTAADIRHSVQIKNDVVLSDPYEKGLRKILNFGHTIGHAIEGYALTQTASPLLHGEAIAIGMVCEAYLSHKLLGLSEQALNEITRTFQNYFPKDSLPAVWNPKNYDDLVQIMRNDKKNLGQEIGFSLLREIGTAEPIIYVGVPDILESLAYYDRL